jgi:glycosyltransferase involved in cell wall biosynthesis
MVGDGADKNQTMVLAEKLGILDEYIVFTGLKEGEELVRIYNQSVFTLLFSNFENMPVVIPESFACGKPVLTSNVGGISEIVDASTGILVSPGDEPQLAKTLDFMLDHYGEFNPSYLSELAVGQFGADAVCSQLSAFYKTAFLC